MSQTTKSKLLDAETRQTVDLKRLIRTADAVVESAPVIINDHGIRLRAADEALVGLIDLHLKPDFFTQYTPSQDDPVEFETDTGELKDAVCEARKSDTVRLSVTNENSERQLQVTVDDTGMQSTFTIPTTAVEDGQIPETDDLAFAGSAVVAIGKLKDAINRMGDSAQLTLYPDRLLIESDTDTGTASVEFREGSDYIHAIHLDDGPITATYATTYLKHITTLKNTVNHVTLQFVTDYPIRIEADRTRFTVAYTLAPRIEE